MFPLVVDYEEISSTYLCTDVCVNLLFFFFSLEKILSSGIGELQLSYMINWIKTAKWLSGVAIPFCIPGCVLVLNGGYVRCREGR